MTVMIANAPVSYGAFELTVGSLPHVPNASRVLDEVAAAGYAGIDLGPPGYLADGGDLGAGLRRRSLHLVGGYLPLPLTAPGLDDAAWAEVDGLLTTFAAATAPGLPEELRPKPTIADAGSPARVGRIGRAATDPSSGLGPTEWARFCANLQEVVDHCRAAGFEPTFHHHAGTHVEAPWEIDRMLEGTDVGLCLDTGHLVVGGGDPHEVFERLSTRVNHLHLKDVDRATVEHIVGEGSGVIEVWRRKAFRALGAGDLDVRRFLDLVEATGFAGWIVVEQDRLPESVADVDEMVSDQVTNRRFLSDLGW